MSLTQWEEIRVALAAARADALEEAAQIFDGSEGRTIFCEDAAEKIRAMKQSPAEAGPK